MFLSVIICTYNRDQHIRRALESLVRQDFERSAYEIIVVDNNSTDNTSKIIHRFKQEHPYYNIVLTRESRQGLSYARNKGLTLAKGKYVSYIDDDGIAREDYVSQIKHYTDLFTDDVAFGGKVLPKYESGKEPGWMSPYIERIISIVDLGNKVKVLKKTYPVGCNMFFKKEALIKIGGFNTAIELRSDDKYVFLKFRESGHRILYLPGVVVWHFIDDYRTTLDYIKKISRLNGEGERNRIATLERKRYITYLLRLWDYVWKLGASIVLWLFYALKGQSIKGKALFLSVWNALQGYLAKQK